MSEPLSAIDLATRIRAGDISAREAVTEAISRIEATRELNAVVHERFEQALAEVDAGLPNGPLTGVPMLVKDLGIHVAGLPLTNGSRLFVDQVSTVDSHLTTLYRRAGLVILGSTNSPELGRSTSTEPLLHGPAHNPWNPEYSAAGSSGGSGVAVAAGLVPVAHANDAGGSIRLPAAMCGLVGLKPSRGRISTWPGSGLYASLPNVDHVVTRTVRDSALLLNLSVHPRPGDPFHGVPEDFLATATTPPGRLRIAWSTTMPDGGGTDPDIAAAVERAAGLLTDLGHEVTEARPVIDQGLFAKAFAPIMRAELQGIIRARLAELGRDLREDDLEPYTRGLYESGFDAAQYHEALESVAGLSWQVGDFFTSHDLWLTPTTGARVPRLGLHDTSDPAAMTRWGREIARFTLLFNLTGNPAISVPFGTDDNGLPVGVQFVGDLGAEGRLLSIAAQLEDAAPWPLTAPWPTTAD